MFSFNQIKSPILKSEMVSKMEYPFTINNFSDALYVLEERHLSEVLHLVGSPLLSGNNAGKAIVAR